MTTIPSKENKKLSEEEILEIKNQVEYYLGDKNLEKDFFFNEIISSDPEGYLDLKYILKCNKVKKKGWTKEDLIKGIELSTIVELDEKCEKVRRKDKKLPELLLMEKKRKRDGAKKSEKKEEIKVDKDEAIILKIISEQKTSTTWKQIFEEFKKLNPEVNVDYGRFQETEGNVSISPKNKNSCEPMKILSKFKIGEIEFTVEKCEGDDLNNFWKEHGTHYEYCMRQRDRQKKNKEEKNQKKKKYLKIPVKLAKKEYNNIDLVKSKTRKIINKYKDNEKLEGEDKDFILDLLKFHHNYEEKVKDMDYIVVDTNNEHKFSRCFFIVDKNKNRKDFSSKKCIENLLEKQNKV